MSKFSFNYSRIELKKDRRDFATNIPREKKKKKKEKRKTQSLLEDAAEHAVYPES